MNGPYTSSERVRREEASASLWKFAGVVYQWRKFIVVTSFLVAVVAAGLTLLIPNWYKGTATVLLPEPRSGGFAALFQNLPSAASSLLGGPQGDYVRYLAILNSRTVLESAVDSFNLANVYELSESENPRIAALKMLRDRVTFELDNEYDYLIVSATDRDPDRAAALSNFFVRRLNAVNTRLATQNAAEYRRFIERRYFEARAAMDSVLDATASFQREYGVYNLPTQTEGFMEQVGQLRASALEAEIQHEALLAQYGPNNPRVQALGEIASAANQKFRNALQGQEALLPVPKSEIPEVGRRFVDLEIERTIQRTILEVLGPMYEQARLQEEQESNAVQVLDPARPPTEKAGPKRTIIVLFAGASAFLLSVVFALLITWWRNNSRYIAGRLESDPVNHPRTAKSPSSI